MNYKKSGSWSGIHDDNDGDICCWNHFPVTPQNASAKRFKQCKNEATWFFYDDPDGSKYADLDVPTIGKIDSGLYCQLCDSCYNADKMKPANETVFDMSLFFRKEPG